MDKKVLLVDDQLNCFEPVFARLVALCGGRLIAGSDVDTALQVIREGDLALVICDGLNGECVQIYELTAELGTPFILHTAKPEDYKESLPAEVKVWEKNVTTTAEIVRDIRGSFGPEAEESLPKV